MKLVAACLLSFSFSAFAVVTFPGATSDLVPELDTLKLKVNVAGGLSFVAWTYDGQKPVAANGKKVCEFLGYSKYVDSLVREVKEPSLKVIIPVHTDNCVGQKYCWGWQNAQQDRAYPANAEYERNRYGWVTPFMVFESISCDDKI